MEEQRTGKPNPLVLQIKVGGDQPGPGKNRQMTQGLEPSLQVTAAAQFAQPIAGYGATIPRYIQRGAYFPQRFVRSTHPRSPCSPSAQAFLSMSLGNSSQPSNRAL